MTRLEDTLRAQLPHTLAETNLPALGQLYRGKVRDVYQTPERLVLITSDRVSAFDHVLGTIPFKGEVLNAIALHFFEATRELCPNHVLSAPDPNVIVGRRCQAFPVEMVVRGYITGSLWRDYQEGKADAYGLPFPAQLKKDQAFAQPIVTPTTKAEIGTHDQAISAAEIVQRGLMSAEQWQAAERLALALFARGSERARARGLILVDTKYELGLDPAGVLTVIDEIHTPDSSRYWVASGYAEHFGRGERQEMLDKENLRSWLIEKHGFKGHGTPPALDDDIRITLASRYLDLYERLVGRPYELTVGPASERLASNLRRAGFLS